MEENNTHSGDSKEPTIFSVKAKITDKHELDGLVLVGEAPPDVIIASCHLIIKMIQDIPWNKETNRINLKPPAMEKGEYIPNCPKCNGDKVFTKCRQYEDRPGIVDVGWKCHNCDTEYGFEG